MPKTMGRNGRRLMSAAVKRSTSFVRSPNVLNIDEPEAGMHNEVLEVTVDQRSREGSGRG